MARKAKRKATNRRPAPVPAGPPASSAVRPVSGRIGGDQAVVRAVEMSLAPGIVSRGRGRNRFVIEGGDPAIPLDRVPYFTRDLVRLAVVGGAMVVLLGVGSIAVPLIVK